MMAEHKHTPGPLEQLLRIVERIDNAPSATVDTPEVLMDLNGWLMDYQEIEFISPRLADAAPDLLAACEANLSTIAELAEKHPDDWGERHQLMVQAIAKATGSEPPVEA